MCAVPRMPKIPKRKMTQQDNLDWEELFEYVRQDIMGHMPWEPLPRNAPIRLRGLAYNKAYDTREYEDEANYPWSLILIVFKYCKPKIMRGFQNNTFENEMKKLSYACAIVENNISSVNMKLKQAEKNKEKINNMDMSSVEHDGASYQKKTGKSSKKFDDLW